MAVNYDDRHNRVAGFLATGKVNNQPQPPHRHKRDHLHTIQMTHQHKTEELLKTTS